MSSEAKAEEDEPRAIAKMAVPRGPPRPDHAWDEQPPPRAPYSHARAWSESMTVTDYSDGHLYKGFPNPVTNVNVRSLKTKEPVPVRLEGDTVHTVADVKVAFRRHLVISSRKAIVLRWLGEELDDNKTLGSCRVPDNALLEAAFKTRTNAELDALKTVTHVLVVDQAGTVIPCEATNSTLVSDLKVQCKYPPETPFHFSPHYTSAFGTPVADDKSLSSCGVLDGDVLYCINPAVVAAPKDAPPPKKK